MVKKIAIISFEVLFIGLCLFLVLQSTSIFQNTTYRLGEALDIATVKTFFEKHDSGTQLTIYINEVEEGVINWFNETFNSGRSFFEVVGQFFNNLWNFLLDLIIYFCNYGFTLVVVLWIIFHESFSKTVEEIKICRETKIYFSLREKMSHLWLKIKQSIIWFVQLLKKHKRKILLHALILSLSLGYLYVFVVELLIFIEVYFIRLFTTETYLMMFSLVGYLLVKAIEILRVTPLPVIVILIIGLIFFSAISKAKFRLTKNHERLKKFVREDITQTTFINGPPGSGKTLLNTSLTLAAEENIIDELEEKMIDYEVKYPMFNFAEVRNNLSSDHPEYFKNYDLERNRSTLVTSNYAIYSPYFKGYSKIFNFDNMRKNKKTNCYALEEYIVISISELDKEYNSHDNMKEVGEDGAATFYSTVSHDLKRHVKIFCDYQLKDQVPLRIRGNSEFFFTIESRKKKYPFLLYLYYLPFIGIKKLTRSFISKYESTRKTINKKTNRRTVSKFKRNDFSLIYAFLRRWAFINDKVCKFFDHFWFYQISGDLSTKDGEKGNIKKLYINLCDLEIDGHYLYDSTFLSYAYETKKNYPFSKLDTFSSLTPNVEELTKCNSRFYNKINGISNPEISEDEPDKNEEVIVDL